jgi:hypothetical protein
MWNAFSGLSMNKLDFETASNNSDIQIGKVFSAWQKNIVGSYRLLSFHSLQGHLSGLPATLSWVIFKGSGALAMLR